VTALTPLLLTFKVALCSTLLAGLAALPLARRFANRTRAAVESALLLPLVLPPTTLGYYLLVLLGRKSAFGRLLEDRLGIHLVFDWKGAVAAAACVSFPLFYKAAQSAFAGVDPRTEEAARLLGASEARVLLKISLPQAGAGLLSAALLAFARSLGDFGATLLVAGNIPGKTQTLSIAIYDALSAGDEARALRLVAVTTAVSYGFLYLAHRSFSRRPR
jgi:molybdate transport system permease protein